MVREPLFGTILDLNPAVQPVKPVVSFRNPQSGGWFGLDRTAANANSLYLGASGSGKTNAIGLHLDQLRAQGANDLFVIFDTKGDFYRDFYQTGDLIIGNDSFSHLPGYVSWNIFKDILSAGNKRELMAYEIGANLFKDRKNQSQPFFSNSAKEVFCNILIHFIRHHSEDRNMMTNGALVRTIKRAAPEWYTEIFSEQVNPDMHGLLSCIGKLDSNQAAGVIGEMKSMLYDLFKDTFASEDYDRSLSIRSFVRNERGRALFVEYDLSAGESLQPMFRLLIDLAMKEAMARPENATGNIYFVLDELHLIPNSEYLKTLLHYGRSKHATVIAGLQSVNQIYAMMEKNGGKSAGQALLSGFPNVFAFRTDDYESRDYIVNLHGDNVVSYYYSTSATRESPVREREGKVVESWDVASLSKGDVIAGICGNPPFRFHYDRFDA